MKEKNFILDNIINRVIKIEQNKECYKLKDLNINGRDLENIGYRGKEIGEKLNILLSKVMSNPKLNEKEILINLV
ncbi:hypothetical protein [Romboutsia sp. Marseille-P6047]|uniref:hypothetical protein n=1 Tax=Romboutsia sp. Marseille-P6047 TaxID=2161817 RepID=UPI000F066592